MEVPRVFLKITQGIYVDYKTKEKREFDAFVFNWYSVIVNSTQ